MTTRKSSNTRKGLALGLAVIGIAGLSLASAAQLNLTGGGTLQAGYLSPITVDCQSAAIPVKFAAPVLNVSGEYASAAINLTGINVPTTGVSCLGKSYKLSALDSAGRVVGGLGEQTGTIATSALSFDVSTLTPAQQITIDRVSLTIYS